MTLNRANLNALQAEKKEKESNTIQEDEHGRRQQLDPVSRDR